MLDVLNACTWMFTTKISLKFGCVTNDNWKRPSSDWKAKLWKLFSNFVANRRKGFDWVWTRQNCLGLVHWVSCNLIGIRLMSHHSETGKIDKFSVWAMSGIIAEFISIYLFQKDEKAVRCITSSFTNYSYLFEMLCFKYWDWWGLAF